MKLQIGILIGVPIERTAFIRAALDPARHFARRFAADPLSAWDGSGGYNERVATPLLVLAAHAEQVGALVVRQAVSTDLTIATSTCDVVAVFAHWKGALVEPEDLPPGGCAAIPDLLRRCQSAVPPEAASELLALAAQLDPVAALNEATVKTLLNKHVCREVKSKETGSDASAFPVAARQQTIRAERRHLLDAVLAGQLRAGNSLELCDGLHPATAVERAIDPRFTGVLDLTVCQSTILAWTIDRARGGRCRIVQFESALETETACLTLQQTLALLSGPKGLIEDASGSDAYLSARSQALRDVADAFARHSRPVPEASVSSSPHESLLRPLRSRIASWAKRWLPR